jgi:hypothetical protein
MLSICPCATAVFADPVQVTQGGLTNYSIIQQGNAANAVILKQLGRTNVVIGQQKGLTNGLDLTQRGGSNNANVTQNGQVNNSFVDQGRERGLGTSGAPGFSRGYVAGQGYVTNYTNGGFNLLTVGGVNGSGGAGTFGRTH